VCCCRRYQLFLPLLISLAFDIDDSTRNASALKLVQSKKNGAHPAVQRLDRYGGYISRAFAIQTP
jgi:hypothetical protein